MTRGVAYRVDSVRRRTPAERSSHAALCAATLGSATVIPTAGDGLDTAFSIYLPRSPQEP